jgi:glycosyltransferase involved in cell wall biosynthesis
MPDTAERTAPASSNTQSSSTQLTVGISIGTYNQAQYLRSSVESALAQTHPISEIWVVDDTSTDNTPEVMAQLCKEYPKIQYHRHEKNMGPARNLSWALAKPQTDLVVRLDSDDRLEPRYVEVLAGLMEKHPQAGYAHCDVWELDENNVQSRHRQLTRSVTYETPEEALKSNDNGLRTAANCLLFRATALKQANYYLAHPTWTFSEDWDLAVRMAILGWGNVYAPETLSNYRQWDDPQGARASRKMMEVQTNLAIFEETLLPEYERRGWSTATLRRNMRRKAVNFADALDSPRFTDADRAAYKAVLNRLGKSAGLSFAFFLADIGLNPLLRSWVRGKRQVKDSVKKVLRGTKPVRTQTA